MNICQCQVDASSRNKLLSYIDLSSGDLIAEIGRLFIHTPYKDQTLESSGTEKLIVNWLAFDCITFLETMLAFIRCIRTRKISYYYFRKNLKLIRYRQGKINGYSSRLHYFVDWIQDNEKKKIVKDVSRSLGGKPKRKKIDFITTHRELYPKLKNKAQLVRMSEIERKLSHRFFYVISKDKINLLNEKIQNGDIIAITASQKGLDVAHVGFAVRQGKNLHLLHASKKEGAVVISKKTLTAYLNSNNKFDGIIVARFL